MMFFLPFSKKCYVSDTPQATNQFLQQTTTTVSSTANARERIETANHRPHASFSVRQKKSKSRIVFSKIRDTQQCWKSTLWRCVSSRIGPTTTSFRCSFVFSQTTSIPNNVRESVKTDRTNRDTFTLWSIWIFHSRGPRADRGGHDHTMMPDLRVSKEI